MGLDKREELNYPKYNKSFPQCRLYPHYERKVCNLDSFDYAAHSSDLGKIKLLE
jgi:hypothetical protein